MKNIIRKLFYGRKDNELGVAEFILRYEWKNCFEFISNCRKIAFISFERSCYLLFLYEDIFAHTK